MIRTRRVREGAIVPLTAVCLTALLGMVALCIDLSIVALAKTQCQNAADMAAMAAARSLDGASGTNNNSVAAFTNGGTAATAAKVMGKSVVASQVALKIGTFTYDSATATFVPANLTSQSTDPNPVYVPPSGYNWGMAEATITSTVNYSFARVLGMTSIPVTATAQAIHRPRDVAIVMDFSGSMCFDSYLARPKTNYADPSYPPYSSLNDDARVPKFGHYDANTAFDANSTNPPYNRAYLINNEVPGYSGDYVRTDSNELIKVGNQTAETTSGLPIVEDFFTLDGSGAMVKAFKDGTRTTPVTAYDSEGFPTAIPNWSGALGDRPLKVNTTPTRNLLSTTPLTYTPSTEYLKTALEFCTPVLTATTPAATVNVLTSIRVPEYEDSLATSLYPNALNGFTSGPGYYGKTFWQWPPVPDATANNLVSGSTVATNATIKDWRQRFFWMVRTSDGQKKRLDDNNVLWQSSGAPRNPNSTYTDASSVGWRWQPNYDAILYWLKNTGPNPFPDNVRSGRILYYESIPDTVANAATNMDQLFWKEFIDYVVGYQGYVANGSGMNLLSGYGNDFTWKTTSSPAAIYTKPGGTWPNIGRLNASYASGKAANSAINVRTASYSTTSATMLNWVPPVGTQIRFNSATSGPIYTIKSVTTTANQWTIQLNESLSASVSSGQQIFANVARSYMDYRDNPYRPKTRFWFGPLLFSDFLWCDFDTSKNRLWRPGTCHEAPMWVLKAGIQSALRDVQKNHPNDWVSMIYFSVPNNSATDSSTARRFNRPRGALGKNYTFMEQSLWYPPAAINTDGTLKARTDTDGEFRPYTSSWGMDSRYREAPYGNGGTCPMWGFTLAYNQFSSKSSLQNLETGYPTGTAGGNGRLGARKLVIFETDGVPNHTATSTFVNGGVGQSYYDVSPAANKYPSVWSGGNMNSTVITSTYSVVRALCDNAAGNTGGNVAAYTSTSTTPTSIARATGLPGYSTNSRPVLVHSLAFGGLFESDSSLKAPCLRFLQTVQTFGNVQSSSSTALADYKIITGTSDERIDKIKLAFTNIMQDGVQITLYK